MNVFDFDKTIFYPDSSATFIKYCLRRYPRYFKANIGDIASSAMRYAFSGRNDSTAMKEQLFAFLRFVPDADALAEEFWRGHIDGFAQWYRDVHRSDDLVISASPEFLLRPAAEQLGFELIATQMNPCSGQIMGVNCRGEEKVRRFREKYPDGVIDDFYSDSYSDAPLAKLAKRAFIVKNGNEISDWKVTK